MQQNKMLEPMSSIDSFWLSMDEPTNLMVITGLMAFDEMLDYDAVCALLKERLLCYNAKYLCNNIIEVFLSPRIIPHSGK